MERRSATIATSDSLVAREELEGIIGELPPCQLAFAYGSGAFHQKGYRKNAAEEPPMLDLVVAVEDSRKWHHENLRRNPGHYSLLLRTAGSGAITALQEQYGARLYYNTDVLMAGSSSSHRQRRIKYGVISSDHLRRDLCDWDWLYAAGRLQKPVHIISGRSLFDTHLMLNLRHAVRASLLQLPEKFTPELLFTTIAGLSYAGDIRIGLAEDPNKVRNIVAGSLGGFQELYTPILQDMEGVTPISYDGSSMSQDRSPASQAKLADMLPSALRSCAAGAGTAMTGPVVAQQLAAIVGRSSRGQAAKGILTAGLIKAASYAAAKYRKSLK